MRIVSLNAWGGAMFDPLAQWLLQCGADVLCVQEVTRTPGLGGATQFHDAERSLPQRANLFNDISTLLPDHQGLFLASDAGPVAGPAGDVHRQDFGIAMFIRQHIPVIGQTAEFVHGNFTDYSEWASGDRPRLTHAARLLDRAAHRTVTVAHLHGLRDPAGKADTPARLAQAKKLASLLERAQGPQDFVVLCGDLNLLPDSETFSILEQVGLTDLVGTADTRTSRYTKPVRHANYMLVSDPGAVVAFEVLGQPEVSDHRPLVLEI